MKVHVFNHWYKYKVPINKHYEQIADRLLQDNLSQIYNFWEWLNEKFDVGQYYNWDEGQNYLVFHNEKHYLMFLLTL